MPSDAFNEKQDLGYVDLEAHDGHSTTTGSHTHLHDAVNLPFQVKSQFAKEMMAEFLATFICMLFGLSCMAQVTLSGGSAGSFVTIALAWGFAYFIGISIGGESVRWKKLLHHFNLFYIYMYQYTELTVKTVAQKFTTQPPFILNCLSVDSCPGVAANQFLGREFYKE
ncbi:hypothetical protein PI126_g12087 [Phytophthora idaei]|nr:hypothetical protein PI126_g12087 [Phytophthora idaei]